MKAQLILVLRDAAKQLFGLREPTELLSFVRELAGDSGVLTLALPVNWAEYNGAFGAAEGEQATIQWALAGGRDLAVGDESTLQMKRPDVVGQLASGVAEFASVVAGDQDFFDPGFCEELVRFYRTAAEQQAAVLFFQE